MVKFSAEAFGVSYGGGRPPPDPNPVKWYAAKFRLTAGATSEEGIHLKKILFEVMTKMRHADDATTFKDAQGEEVQLSEWETIKPGDFNHRFSVVTRGGKKPEAILGFEVRASVPAVNIRKSIIGFSKQHKVFFYDSRTKAAG